jgi:hypothetical protein
VIAVYDDDLIADDEVHVTSERLSERPLSSRDRPSFAAVATAGMCHKQTHAPQQDGLLVGAKLLPLRWHHRGSAQMHDSACARARQVAAKSQSQEIGAARLEKHCHELGWSALSQERAGLR